MAAITVHPGCDEKYFHFHNMAKLNGGFYGGKFSKTPQKPAPMLDTERSPSPPAVDLLLHSTRLGPAQHAA